MAVHKLVLVRHGESVWNEKNLFTGWTDVELSAKGKVEAAACGALLKKEGYQFDVCYTSVLKRAIHTMNFVLDGTDMNYIPIVKAWQLNERMYGDLQGLDKAETAAKYGEAQVKVWRRSYDIPPPPLKEDDPRHPKHHRLFQMHVPADAMPATESLKSTLERFLPYWHSTIGPDVLKKNVLIVAHGNSLRALVKHLDNVPEGEITELNIPTGVPLVYELDAQLKPIRHYYLGDAAEIAAKQAAVAAQASAKK